MYRNDDFFELQETTLQGEPVGALKRLNYPELKSMLYGLTESYSLPTRLDQRRQFNHLLTLAHAAPHHPVDLWMYGEPQQTPHSEIASQVWVWTARVTYQGADPARGTGVVACDVL
jgi:hypothetical protein